MAKKAGAFYEAEGVCERHSPGGEQVDYDAEVLRQASHGDDAAFDALVEPHLPRCYRIAYMITRNHDDASDARSSRQPESIPLPEAEAGDTPEGTLLAREQQKRLWQAIQALPPDQRAVIILRYYGDMSEQEMAKALNVIPGTIKSRLHRARAALENLLSVDRGIRPQGKAVQVQTAVHGGGKHE